MRTRAHTHPHTLNRQKNITFYQKSNPWLYSIDICIPKTLGTQTAYVTEMMIHSNELYTKFHAKQWYRPVFASLSYTNM
jgi:hypothetical protein